ncbi:helix-turn-helix transcriptional regulator [Flavobacterium sp. SM2513]|uniref:helix-turn-helix transcriptional regulator n=1 Tax=Flavobacterium sp. SM2513 TaxID=3424766 RepID=UPI003D7F6B90
MIGRIQQVVYALPESELPLVYLNEAQPLLVLESGGSGVRTFHPHFALSIGYEDRDLCQCNLAQLLTPESLELFTKVLQSESATPYAVLPIALVFVTAANETVLYYCSVIRVAPTQEVHISSRAVAVSYRPVHPLLSKKLTGAPRMQAVYDFIVGHLEEPLPSTPAIAQHFGMNTFQLKQEFRAYFKTSIYQLYTDVRLQRAYVLITSNSLSLNSIALESGFPTYLSFYKAFRKKYQCSPTQIAREMPLK